MHKLSAILLRARFLFAVMLLVTAVSGYAVQGHASKTDLMNINEAVQDSIPTVRVVRGMAEVVDVDGPIADIMLADPTIADVTALQSNRLYLVGITIGYTNVIVLDDKGDVIKRFNVMVTIDTQIIEEKIHQLFPGEDVSIDVLRGQIIMKGTVSTPDVAQRIQNLVLHHITDVEGTEDTADRLIVNLIKIRGKAQVMLRVKILEVSRTLLRERTADTNIDDIGMSLNGHIRNSESAQLGGLFGGVFSPSVSQTPFAAFGLLESFGALGPLDTVITLLEDAGLARLMAEPNLTAISGEQAGFLAGGEFPVPSSADSNGNVIITFRPFGVSLSFRPIVLDEDRISLEFETELSSVSRDSDATLAGVQVPGLDVRRASTTVEMGSGMTLMIAGLLQSQTVKNLSGIPGMVNTPIIGDLMSSKSFQRDESEMVVMVTPYLVEPFGDKRQANKVPRQGEKDDCDLGLAFARNIRRTYGAQKVEELFEGDMSYGYILD